MLTIKRQCELVGISRSSWYYQGKAESAENLLLMRLIDEKYMECPFYGSRRMAVHLQRLGYKVNRKRARRLMRMMGLEAIYPKPNLSLPDRKNMRYPYLLKGLAVDHPNQVWSTDITYIPLAGDFVYLTVIMDWYSRYVISWELSNTMDVEFCISA